MALPIDQTVAPRDRRALSILAKTLHRELRSSGYVTGDVIAFATELLSLVAKDVRGKNTDHDA